MGKLIKKHRWSILLVLIGIIALIIFNFYADPAESTEPAYAPENVAVRGLTPLYWLAGIIGGCIALTLSYVSWRKYKGQNKKRKKS